MKKIRFEMENPPAKVEDMKRLEEHFCIQLPEDMKQFYLEHNGGVLPKESRIDEESCRLRHFLSLEHQYQEQDTTIYEMLKWQKMDGFIPMKYVPFCMDEAGDFYYIQVSGEEYGTVYYIFSECLDDFLNDPKGEGLIAHSFSEFLECIK